MLVRLLWLLLLICIPFALAEPPLPGVEFYGWVVHDGYYARPGTLITAHFLDGQICGETRLEATGHFTQLSCKGDSSRIGDPIVFRVNYDKAMTSLNHTFTPGEMRHVDIFTGTETEARIVLRQIPKYTLCEDCLIRLALAGSGAIVLLTIVFFMGRWTKKG